MNIALIMNENSYVGREYLSKLILNEIRLDVIIIGDFPAFDKDEDERCGGLWNPTSQDILLREIDFYRFKSLKSLKLENLLLLKNYDLGIQGGTGILKIDIINKFKQGFINFHPGNLPNYRGCSAPEWQLYECNDIVSTCHLIDEGIDSGPIIAKQKLSFDYNNYFEFRSNIYKETSVFMLSIVKKIINRGEMLDSEIQNEKHSRYRKYIGEERINELKNRIKNINCKIKNTQND